MSCGPMEQVALVFALLLLGFTNQAEGLQAFDGRLYQPQVQDGVVVLTVLQQTHLLLVAELECINFMKNTPYPENGTYCNRTWDRIMCWPDVPAGHTARQPCATYINGFKINETAGRECTEDGTWFFNPNENKTWTNFSLCTGTIATTRPVSEFIENNWVRIRLMSNVGYALSLVTLCLAVFVMVYFKKLHCPRNTVHINLFISFILRGVMPFIKDSLMVNGLALRQDFYRDAMGNLHFKEEGSHWECRLFMTIFNYVISANYMWIFVEGLYLYTLIFVSVFSEKSSVIWYIIFGWASPLLFVIPWAIARATLENVLCWNTHPTPGYFWIIKCPISVSVLINFFLFLNIVRVLFTKLKATNTAEARMYRYIKLAKSTLVLIPLFGVYYIVFLALQDDIDESAEVAKLYFEMFFNSFQGLLIAMLFCFLNGEVRTEIKKKWQRYQLQRGSSIRLSNRSTGNTLSTDVNVINGTACNDSKRSPIVFIRPQAGSNGTQSKHGNNSLNVENRGLLRHEPLIQKDSATDVGHISSLAT